MATPHRKHDSSHHFRPDRSHSWFPSTIQGPVEIHSDKTRLDGCVLQSPRTPPRRCPHGSLNKVTRGDFHQSCRRRETYQSRISEVWTV